MITVEEITLEAVLGTGGHLYRMTQTHGHEKMERQVNPESEHLQHYKMG